MPTLHCISASHCHHSEIVFFRSWCSNGNCTPLGLVYKKSDSYCTRLVRGDTMRLSLVQSRALLGLQAPSVTVEVHLANGLPSFTLVGLADVEVKEARERVRSALQNSGFEFPSNQRITVNLAPRTCPKTLGALTCPLLWVF